MKVSLICVQCGNPFTARYFLKEINEGDRDVWVPEPFIFNREVMLNE